MADGTIERKDIISDDVYKGLEILENSLKKNVDLIDALTKKSIENSKQIATSTNQAIKNDTELIEIQKKSVQAQTAVYESQKKLIDARVKLSAEQKEQIRIQKLNEIANNTEAGAIERLRANIKLLESERIKMTDVTGKNKDAYTQLISKIEQLRAEEISLGTIQDKQIANIGNYQYNLNGLNMSFNQLTREMPAFAFSMSTGFMAISNNIPMFADQINQLIDKNKQLKAQNQETVPVWKMLAGSIFSWQTAMSLGVTLLTVFGGKIAEFVSNLFKSNEAIERQTELQKQLNETSRQANKNAQDDIVVLDVLYKISQDHTRSLDERKKAVDELQKQYPEYLGGLSDESILSGRATAAYNLQRQAIIDVAMAQAYKDKIAENAKKIVDIDDEIDKENKKLKIQQEQTQRMKQSADQLKDVNLQMQAYVSVTQSVGLESAIENDIKSLNNEKKLIEEINEKYTKRIKVESLTNNDKTSKPTENDTKQRIEDEKKKYKESIDYQIELFKTKFDYIKDGNRTLTNEEDAFFYNSIEKMKIGVQQSNLSELEKQKIINQFNDYQKKINDYELSFIKEKDEREKKSIQDRIKLQEEANKLTQDQLQNNVDVLIQQANQLESQDDMQQASFKELESMRLKLENQKLIVEATQQEGTQKEKNLASLDKELTQITKKQKQKLIALVNEVSDTASLVNDIITGVYGTQLNLIEGNEQRELEASARKRDTNIANGMAQTEAEKKYQDEQAAIKKKYAKEEYEIKRKQAIWDKAYALVQIATQTAIAMIAAWKENSVIAIIKEGLIIAAAVASSALVLSKPIPKAPEYWKGTDYHPGGLAKVGDRYGRELVTLPSGKQFITPDTETIMDLPKGTKVDTNAKLKRMLSGLNSNESHEQNTINEQLLKELISTTKNKKMLKVDINEKGLSVLADSGQIRTRFINNRYRD